MKTISKIILPLTLIGLLAGCAPDGEQTTDQGNNSTGGDVTLPEEGEFTVSVKVASSLVTLTPDKQFAKKGETVTIKVTFNDANTKIARVLYGHQTCNKVDNSTYTFVMPNNPVTITCELIMEGDVTLQGDIAAKFEKEGDLYVARGVEVNSDAIFDMSVAANDGTVKKMSTDDFDRFKTFANIGASYGTKRKLTIAGGATYDFYYDTNNGKLPCYVVRTKVNDLPSGSTPKSLLRLFAGNIHGETSVLPNDVIGMTYENKTAKDKVVWEAYEDGKSFAKVSTLQEDNSYKEDRYIYNEINNGQLKVVDTFTPGLNETYAGNDELHKDKVAFSGLYKVNDVDEKGKETSLNEFDHTERFISSNVANSLINNAPITMYDFEQDIRHAYRDGLNKGGNIVQSSLNITSTELNESAFSTKIVSSKTFDNSLDSHKEGVTIQKHYEYRCDLIFSTAGALISGHYVEKLFDNTKYNFENQSFIDGDADTNFEANTEALNDISVEYVYGAKDPSSITFNPDKYFISDISSITINNPKCEGAEPNKLNVGDMLDDYLTIKFAPSTALNAYQYDIISSSDNKIVKKDTNGYVSIGMGDVDITVGIINKLGTSSTTRVKVIDSRTIKAIYLNARNGNFQECVASSANIFTGQMNEFGLDVKFSDNTTSGIQGIRFPSDLRAEFVEDDSKGFTVAIDHENQSLIINGSNAKYTQAEVPEELHVRILTNHLDPDWADSIKPLEFKIYKGTGFDDIVGTWTCKEEGFETDTVTLTKEPSGVEVRPYKGIVHTPEQDYEFNYSYNAHRHTFNAMLVGEQFDVSNIFLELDPTTNELGCIIEYVKWTAEELSIEYKVGYIENHNKLFAKFVKEAN